MLKIEAMEKFVSDAEAREFVRMAQKGNLQAMEIIVRTNVPMVAKCATSYSRRGSCFEDLVQEGNRAILNAVEKFNLDSDVTVGTALITAVRTAMKRYANSDRNVHIAINASENRNKIYAVIERLKSERKAVTLENIALESNCPIRLVKRLVSIELGVVSMNEKAEGDECEGSEFGDSIADESETPSEAVERADSWNAVFKALGSLTAVEKVVVEYHWGVNGKPRLTLAEIAKTLNRSQEGVRVIEARAFLKLRKAVQ